MIREETSNKSRYWTNTTDNNKLKTRVNVFHLVRSRKHWTIAAFNYQWILKPSGIPRVQKNSAWTPNRADSRCTLENEERRRQMDPMMGTKVTPLITVQNKALNLENTGPEQGNNTRLENPRISELGRNKTQTGANDEVVKNPTPPK